MDDPGRCIPLGSCSPPLGGVDPLGWCRAPRAVFPIGPFPLGGGGLLAGWLGGWLGWVAGWLDGWVPWAAWVDGWMPSCLAKEKLRKKLDKRLGEKLQKSPEKS